MRKGILELMICPNTNVDTLSVYAHKLRRNDRIISHVEEEALQVDDDIIEGLLFNKEKKFVYPIHESIPVLLSDSDIDLNFHTKVLLSLRKHCPVSLIRLIDFTMNRLKFFKPTLDGTWNREEMAYFDRKVSSERLRKELFLIIKKVPIWNLFLTREYLLNEIRFNDKDRYVLEVGCGNARTVHWIFNPKQHHYNYIGSDISFKRLLLAKRVIPEGDFVQCSAFNLPFKDEVLAAIIGFGVFHHLPDPLVGVRNCALKIKPDGYFALHEPFKRPALVPDAMAKIFFKNLDKDTHDNKIDAKITLLALRSFGFNVILEKYENSLFRSLAISMLEKMPGLVFKKRLVIEIINFIDEILLKSVCRISKRLGPSGLLVLAKRPKR